jgi:hypothetical protein
MGIMDTVKNLGGLIGATGNIEMMRLNVELSTQIMELHQEKLEVDAENRRLRDRAVIARELKFRANSYWRGEEGPFCSRCWDADDRLVRLHQSTRGMPFCPGCNTIAVDPEAQPPKPIQRRYAKSPYIYNG